VRPERREGFVEIAVGATGLCRTDLYVAEGRIEVDAPRILGHEFSGVVSFAPPGSKLEVGSRVTAFPIFATDRSVQGYGGEMLGVHRDGSFAEFVAVPESVVLPIGRRLSYEEAAFSEPIAAALAVLKADLRAQEKGCIVGSGRIAQLLSRVLKTQGLNVPVVSPQAAVLEEGIYDYVIESFADLATWRAAVRAVKHGGLIVAKSRSIHPVEVPYLDLVQKEVTVKAVHYGSFALAVELLISGELRVDDLIGERASLSDYERVLDRARTGEASKQFFVF
jgi:L-iditol 2-dehydrogenase